MGDEKTGPAGRKCWSRVATTDGVNVAAEPWDSYPTCDNRVTVKMNRLFVSGMFRSGTTLMARMLHTHRDIACASDPYRPFFNCFRDSVAAELGVEVEPYAPLGSYFADDDQRRIFDTIQTASLDRDFDRDRNALLNRIRSHGRQFSPRIIENLAQAPGKTFEDVYRNLLDEVPEHYGDGTEEIVGTKEVWTTEFVPVLAEAFPEAKFLLVVRDPRAVAASNNVNEDRQYPWTFLARQWRKLAILAWVHDSRPAIADRVHLVRYEDLVESPDETATDLCEFLDIDLDERILDPSNFVDGRGEQWLQNTSYDEGGASFNTDSVDKWRGVLDAPTVAFLEQLCSPTMDLLGYGAAESPNIGIDDSLLLDPPTVIPERMADWITPRYEGRSATAVRSELGTEHVRQRMLRCEDSVRERLDEETIRTYFLNVQYFETVCDLYQS